MCIRDRVGGTGFYIQAVTKDIDFTEAQQENDYRKKLEALAEEKGGDHLHEMLRKVDPVSADAIHAHNVKLSLIHICKKRGNPRGNSGNHSGRGFSG